jgi:hypothetical protein
MIRFILNAWKGAIMVNHAEKHNAKYKGCGYSYRLWWIISICVVLTFITMAGSIVFFPNNAVASYSWDTITTFEYNDSKDAKKLIKKYEELIESDDIHLVGLDAKKHLNGTTEYKQTTKSGDVQYLGSLKSGQPNGFGILFEKNSYDGVYMPEFIGDFSKGYLDGYGIWFSIEGSYYYPNCEGHYKKGKLDGQYYEYMMDILGTSDENYDTSYALNNAKYDDSYGSVVFDYPIVKTELRGGGKMKNGNMDGKWTINGFTSDLRSTFVAAEIKFSNKGKKAKGKLYYEDGAVKYDGEMNGDLQMDGKGTLYREDGSVEHKGQFKKGDIKK